MKVSTATNHIQFRNGAAFKRAGTRAYLKRLGISRLYASPIFTATSVSTHGCDVTDANEDRTVDRQSPRFRMAQTLKATGLVLDSVSAKIAMLSLCGCR
jgi:(1->4)-alpha-D-glucan 1-alpha-D-glucosylmutase